MARARLARGMFTICSEAVLGGKVALTIDRILAKLAEKPRLRGKVAETFRAQGRADGAMAELARQQPSR
jgi:hypothetical protein